MSFMKPINVIENTCSLLLDDDFNSANELIENNYKHNFIKYDIRSMSINKKLNIFLQDGFIDRYTGNKLFFPSVLRILSIKLGKTFPFHPNWKMTDCHIAYWEYFPTYDHIIPIARGGKDIPENIVTTSMKMNSVKSNFLIEEIGLKLYEKGNLNNWNGMLSWYLRYIEKNTQLLDEEYLLRWHKALIKCIKDNKINIV